jgi:YopX protein
MENREIKFRGISNCENPDLHPQGGEWVFGQVVFYKELAYIVGEVVECNDEYINLERWCSIRPETLGQFVCAFGGSHIFQGDIVEYDTEDGIAIAQVVFKESDDEDDDEDIYLSGFALKATGDTRDYTENENAVGIKVIGNIHDNPELLEASA